MRDDGGLGKSHSKRHRRWADFEYVLEKELIGLGDKFTMGMVVRERGDS